MDILGFDFAEFILCLWDKLCAYIRGILENLVGDAD